MWPLLIMKQSDGMETHRARDKLQYACMYGCQVTIKGLSKLIGSYLKLVEECNSSLDTGDDSVSLRDSPAIKERDKDDSDFRVSEEKFTWI